MRHLLFACSVLALASCQCVSVPELDYACVDNTDCDVDESCIDERCVVQMVVVDGGHDAGTIDSGTPDAGEVDAGFDAGLLCNSWSCVTTVWPQPSALTSSESISSGPLPGDVDGGTYGWFGGVLLPDGRVLAVPHTASQFLVFDPTSLTAQTFGAPLDEPPAGEPWPRSYAGGVLHPNGKVYVFPYHAKILLEVDPTTGTRREVGSLLLRSDGGFPNYVGGVVDKFGFIWTVSESSAESVNIYRYDPVTETAHFFEPPPGHITGWGGWWGMARMPDDTLLAFPKEYVNNQKDLSKRILAITPGAALTEATFEDVENFDISDVDAGFPMQGASLTAHGAVCGTAAGTDTRFVCVEGRRATMHEGPVSAWGMSGTFSDGRVWTTPDSSSNMVRLQADGGSTTRTVTVAGRYGFLGLVATPRGMVLIPGSPSVRDFVVVTPGGASAQDTRPMPVLLSPYFNKL